MPQSPEDRKKRKAELDKLYRERVKADPILRQARAEKRIAAKKKRMQNPEYASKLREDARARQQKNYYKDVEMSRKKAKEWREGKIDIVRARQREANRLKRLDPAFVEKKRISDRKSRAKHIEKRLATTRQFYRENRDRINAERRERNALPEKKLIIAAQKREYFLRNKTNPSFLFLHYSRSRFSHIKKVAKLGRVPKVNPSRFQDYFGCDVGTLVAHIEAQFVGGMSWENHGKVWHLDHIIPISLGKESLDLCVKLNHYKNLRPLLVEENLRKNRSLPDFWPEGVPFTKEELGL